MDQRVNEPTNERPLQYFDRAARDRPDLFQIVTFRGGKRALMATGPNRAQRDKAAGIAKARRRRIARTERIKAMRAAWKAERAARKAER
jgi:hypothetical protein